MKSTPKIIILFAVLLTGLVHITAGQPSQAEILRNFNTFTQKLKHALENPKGFDWMKDEVKGRMLKDFEETSFHFKTLCAAYCNSSDILRDCRKIIDIAFEPIEQSAKEVEHLLGDLKRADPVGFLAYLEKENVPHTSARMQEYVRDYLRIMHNETTLFRHNPGTSTCGIM